MDDLAKLAAEARKQFAQLGKDFQEAFVKVADEAEYKVDIEFGKFIAKHPELYAELKKGYKQFKRTADKVAEDLGLR